MSFACVIYQSEIRNYMFNICSNIIVASTHAFIWLNDHNGWWISIIQSCIDSECFPCLSQGRHRWQQTLELQPAASPFQVWSGKAGTTFQRGRSQCEGRQGTVELDHQGYLAWREEDTTWERMRGRSWGDIRSGPGHTELEAPLISQQDALGCPCRKWLAFKEKPLTSAFCLAIFNFSSCLRASSWSAARLASPSQQSEKPLWHFNVSFSGRWINCQNTACQNALCLCVKSDQVKHTLCPKSQATTQNSREHLSPWRSQCCQGRRQSTSLAAVPRQILYANAMSGLQ